MPASQSLHHVLLDHATKVKQLSETVIAIMLITKIRHKERMDKIVSFSTQNCRLP